jgi:hypothetical protein
VSSSAATASIAQEMFGEMAQSYGFHNLNRQSLFPADGTEHSYFTLSADYPLEQATTPGSPSAGENVGVTDRLSIGAQATVLSSGLQKFFQTNATSCIGMIPRIITMTHTEFQPNNRSKVFVQLRIKSETKTRCKMQLQDTIEFWNRCFHRSLEIYT